MTKTSTGMNRTIAIAGGVMQKLFANKEVQFAKGAEQVWRALIVARNTAQPPIGANFYGVSTAASTTSYKDA